MHYHWASQTALSLVALFVVVCKPMGRESDFINGQELKEDLNLSRRDIKL